MNKNLAFLYEYINNPSPVGFEQEGQKIWLNYLKPYIDEYITDIYGNTVGVINPNKQYKVVIEAHADEISWFVNYITDDGYIYVIRNGGSDALTSLSQKCKIFTKKGIVSGVFGWPALHVRKHTKFNTTPDVSDIFVDIGANSKTEVEALGVTVGCVITLDVDLSELNQKFYVGRALDNRMGGFIIAEVARKLKENNVELPFTLYIVNSVQEEIGKMGAEMISRRLKPDVAICCDVTHDTQSPMYNKKTDGDLACGKGPVLTYAPAVQNNLLNFIIDVATEKNIPFQRAASSRLTGTDTDSFAYSSEGVASALISLPQKYMHTTVEMCHKDDIEACINMYYQVLLKLEAGQDFRYIN